MATVIILAVIKRLALPLVLFTPIRKKTLDNRLALSSGK
jgi:hypothetical protein